MERKKAAEAYGIERSLRWATANVERTPRGDGFPKPDGKSAMERTGFPTDEEPF